MRSWREGIRDPLMLNHICAQAQLLIPPLGADISARAKPIVYDRTQGNGLVVLRSHRAAY
jgi:hypothetical protein